MVELKTPRRQLSCAKQTIGIKNNKSVDIRLRHDCNKDNKSIL